MSNLRLPTAAELTDKWVKVLGLGFHPDTRGIDYVPAMTVAQVLSYDADMRNLFELFDDPNDAYDACIAAWKRAGLI